MPVIPPSFLHSSLISRSVLSVQGENELALSDIELLEWFRNDGLKVEWCPLSFQGVASSQSTHHPLQRMMGGLTCRFEWYWMIRMISKWWSQSFQREAASQSTHHPLQRMMGGLTCIYILHIFLYNASQSTHHPLQRMMGGLTCRFEW